MQNRNFFTKILRGTNNRISLLRRIFTSILSFLKMDMHIYAQSILLTWLPTTTCLALSLIWEIGAKYLGGANNGVCGLIINHHMITHVSTLQRPMHMKFTGKNDFQARYYFTIHAFDLRIHLSIKLLTTCMRAKGTKVLSYYAARWWSLLCSWKNQCCTSFYTEYRPRYWIIS